MTAEEEEECVLIISKINGKADVRGINVFWRRG
jgi:hypothetical protein